MRSFLILVLGLLFSSSALAQWAFTSYDDKGSYHIHVKQDTSLFSKAANLNKNTLGDESSDNFAVKLVTTGTPGDIDTLVDATGIVLYTVHVDAAKATTVEVMASGKMSNFASGSGSVRWYYSGTGDSTSLQSENEYGLLSAPKEGGACYVAADACQGTANADIKQAYEIRCGYSTGTCSGT